MLLMGALLFSCPGSLICPEPACPALQAGVIAVGEVDRGALQIFSFATTAGNNALLRLTMIGASSSTLYVSTGSSTPVIAKVAPYTVTGAQYTSEWDQGALSVSALAHLGQPIKIAVALTDATSTSARFSIVATHADADIVSLEEGIPQFGSAVLSTWTHFRAEIFHAPTVDGTTPALDITVGVTALEGDPDVYVNQFQRTTSRTPTLAPTPLLPGAAGCGTLAAFAGSVDAAEANLFVGISDWAAAEATTTQGSYYTYLKAANATYRKASALRESALGAVSFQTCRPGFENWYLRRVGSRLKLQRNDGSDGFAADASWYVRRDGWGGAEAYESASKPDNYIRRGTSARQRRDIFVTRGITNTLVHKAATWTFALAAGTPSAPTAQPTFPPTMAMPPAGGGEWPTQTSQFAAREEGSDVIQITSTSAHACAPDATKGISCELLISINSFTASKFTVLLSFSSSWRYATNLLDGVPQTAGVGFHQYSYFVFGFEEEKAGGEVEISLNPHTAGADHDLFVCAGSCSTDADHSDAPSTDHYEYRSIAASGEDFVRIATDALVCGGANSTSIDGGGEGVPTPAPAQTYAFDLPCAAPAVATANDKHFYMLRDISFGSRHAMVFAVKASHDAHVGLFTAAFCPSSATNPRCGQPDSHSLMYEVVFGGWSNSLSVIRRCYGSCTKVHSRTQAPLSAASDNLFWISYDISSGVVAAGSGNVVGSSPIMTWTDPSPLKITKVGVMTGFGAVGTWHACSATPPPPPVGWCLLNIAVYSYYKAGESLFTIAASTGAASIRLRDGVPQQRHLLRARTYEYFLLKIGDVHRQVAIHVTSMSAMSVDIYVSVINATAALAGKTKPSRSTHDWASTSWLSSNSLTIKATDPLFCTACDLWVAVYGHQSGDFSIVATMSEHSVTELIDGQLQSASVERNGWIYFYFLLGAEHTSLALDARSAVGGGAIALFIAENAGSFATTNELVLPNASYYEYATATAAAPRVTLPAEDLVPGATYVVGVHGTSTLDAAESIAFTISLTTDTVDLPLTLGVVDGEHYIGTGAMAWFRAEAGRVDKDAFFAVTPTEGSVDVVISTRGGRPTCTPWATHGGGPKSSVGRSGQCANFTWRFTAEALNTTRYPGEMIVAHSRPCESAYYPQYYDNCDATTEFRDTFFIGIYGRTSSRFSILASLVGMQTTLLDSAPLVTRTTPIAVCDRTDSGACSDTIIMRDGAFFSFSVTRDMDVQRVDIAVEILNAMVAIKASANTELLALDLFVRSCFSDSCTEAQRYPEPLHCAAAGTTDCSSPPTLVIAAPIGDATQTRLSFTLDQSADAWCPVSATKGACVYSIGLFTDLSVSGVDGARDNGGVVFRIEFSSSAGMEVVPGESILGVMRTLSTYALTASTPATKFDVTPFNMNHDIAEPIPPTDLFVVRLEACVGTVVLSGCGSTGVLAPASYRKVANEVLAGGFTGYTRDGLQLAEWPCLSQAAGGGEYSACGTALHSACVAKCEATTPPCHQFSVEYSAGATVGATDYDTATPCRVCDAANGDSCPTHNFDSGGARPLSNPSMLYATSGCKSPRSPSMSDNDFELRTPLTGDAPVPGVDAASRTLLLAANGDDAVVVVNALLDLPSGRATPTFVMSVGGSSAEHLIRLITEPPALSAALPSSITTLDAFAAPTMTAIDVGETSVTLRWPLAQRCPVSFLAYLEHESAVDCTGESAAAGLSYQIYAFNRLTLVPGEHIASPCGLDANARTDVNGPFPSGFKEAKGVACTQGYTVIAQASLASCAAHCSRDACGGFTFPAPQSVLASEGSTGCLVMDTLLPSRCAASAVSAGDAARGVTTYTRDTSATRDITMLTLTDLAPSSTYVFVLLVSGAHGERMTYTPIEVTTAGGGTPPGAHSADESAAAAAAASNAFALIAAGVASLLFLALLVVAGVAVAMFIRIRRMRAHAPYSMMMKDVSGDSSLSSVTASDIMAAPLIGAFGLDYEASSDFALMRDGSS